MGRKRDMKIADMVGKPISEKMDRLEEAVRRDGEQTRVEYKKQIGDVKKVVDVMMEDLSAREKKELYDLNTVVDIAELEKSEKEFLIAVLYTLAVMTEEVTDAQQSYIRSVKNYIDVKNIQTMVDLSCIENIDSKKQERAILQTVMEFLFLENCNHDYWDEYSDVLDYFSVKNSEIRKIQTCIDAIYRATGAMGLSEKFGYAGEDGCAGGVSHSSIATVAKDKFEKYINVDYPLVSFIISLNSSISDMNYNDEDIHSRPEAERRARRQFSSIYADAESYFNKYSDNSLSKQASDELFKLIKNDVLEIIDAVKNLDDDTRRRNSTIIEETLRFLDLNTLEQRISELAEKELSDRYYSFSDISHYLNQIEYSEFDHDPPGLFGKKDWWFDGMQPWMELDNDLSDKAQAYCKYLSTTFSHEIIRPIIDFADRIK